ncbi:glycosyltransferase family 2 protein [Lachnospira pectinoschiza]|uniref:Glycosyltransferase involved in cell wall bisynthesis n=1 Tax=Lachnospira pectinoschiza TaxID=28052 RepID=A0A1G9U483_9FIRM|nr:glycosyltransferase family 2 protein [Lachnospira pectinoschiza]SDM54688.1 Glycosyltransferase involved in cell wall bisynthesis [Lachnospira pectinoschiza]
MTTFSLCLIVKNEEKCLRECLDSYKPAFDEIVVVDTGSTDATKEIALEYTDKIYDFKWVNDFSAARNFAFSKCSCDYIFSADADEVLTPENLEMLLKLKEVMMPEIEMVTFLYVNDSKYNTSYNFKTERRAKLYKRIRQFTWISPIHETVRLDPVIFDSDISISHRPISNHSKRDFDIYYKSLDSGVTFLDYALCMFIKELFISGDRQDFLKAHPYLEKMSRSNYYKEDTLKYIRVALIHAYRLENDFDNFFKLVSLELCDNPSAETCLELGYYYEDNLDYEQAILWFINAANETASIIDIHACTDTPRYSLSRCYKKLALEAEEDGDDEMASKYNDIAKEYEEQADNVKLPEVDD